MFSYDIKAKAEYLNWGLALSLSLHALLVYEIFSRTNFLPKLPPKVVYSISVEGGKNLGGIAQVPDPKNKADIAPPKKVVEKKATPPQEVKKEEVIVPKKEIVKKEEKKPEVKEVKKEVKPEVKKEVKKEEPKKEPVKEDKKVEQKKVEPTKKEEKKPDPKKSIEESYEEAMQKYLGESTNAGGTGFGSAGTGGKGLGGGVVKSPAWFKYHDEIQSLIKKGWNWHETTSSLFASVAFKISEKGEISDIRIAQSSGDSKFDDSALRAVQKANPLPAAPVEIYPDFRELIVDFEPGML